MSTIRKTDFEGICKNERDELVERRKELQGKTPSLRAAGDDGERAKGLRTTGLSLSGGGVRSACFNLGFLEGLDRLACRPVDRNGKELAPAPDSSTPGCCLEYFDYVSSVSGGSYAAGYFAMTMAPAASEAAPTAAGAETEAAPSAAGGPEPAAWLGKADLTSKTVPGWLWGLGAWFLGVVHQLLKTGSLLVGGLAIIAFVLRMLDAPSSNRFWYVLGLRTDVSRGFVPFWVSLGVFLTAYGFHASRFLRPRIGLWFWYTGAVVAVYIGAVWWMYEKIVAEGRSALPFQFQYGVLLALVLPVLVFCIRVLGSDLFRWLMVVAFSGKNAKEEVEAKGATAKKSEERDAEIPLRNILLAPVLVALFCLAGLVTTGDVGLTSYGDSPDEFQNLLEKGQWYGQLGDKVYKLAIGALGVISVVFLFPRRLFQSARDIEDRAMRAEESPFRRWGLDPVFRVIVFLCSYGFVLLLVFVVYSTVARENVSGYFEWRDSLRSATLHPSEFRSWERAWDQIARDAEKPSASAWGPLAARLMAARNAAAEKVDGAIDSRSTEGGSSDPSRSAPAFSLSREKAETVEIRLLDAMPWVVRLAPFLMGGGPDELWKRNGLEPSRSLSRLYDLMARADQFQLSVSEEVSTQVLSLPDLYTVIPKVEKPVLIDVDLKSELAGRPPVGWKAALDAYRAEAERLAMGIKNARPDEIPALEAAVGNNNREVLRLYLPNLIRDRHSRNKQIFSWVVWREDQWSRLRIACLALVLWVLCCTVDANTFSLQRFYRRHVIESWVWLPPGQKQDDDRHWLDDVGRTYRGCDHDATRPDSSSRTPRRAPLLLFNTTLEGNRSLGHEPSMTHDLFTFSPVGSGSGATGYWPNDRSLDRDASFIHRNNLDIGNVVATSGAFLSPGTIANPALFIILHLLNIQTGYWVHDPAAFDVRSPWEGLLFQLSQSAGIDIGNDSRFMLSDGAHVENLGLYALLRRRCSLIVASDCSQGDGAKAPERRFDALMQVLQQAGVDGVEFGPFLNSHGYRHWLDGRRIEPCGGRPGCDRAASTGLKLLLAAGRPASGAGAGAKPAAPAASPSAGNGFCAEAIGRSEAPAPGSLPRTSAGENVGSSPQRLAQEHYLFCWIRYPDGREGLLVYLRPTLTGDEGGGLLHAATGSEFPDDDPLDQFYTPAKMNTYRLLGRHIATMLMNDPVIRAAFGEFVRGEPNVIGDASRIPHECGCRDGSCDWRRQPWLSQGPSVRRDRDAEWSEETPQEAAT